MNVPYTSAWTESLKAEGRTEGQAEMLLRVLKHKGIEVSDQVRQRILGCTEPARIEAWADKVFDTTITHTDQLFDE